MRRRFDGSAALKSGADSAPKFSSIQGVLQNALKQHGLDKEIARYNFVLHWKEIVGEDIASRTRPECIRGKALVVRVLNSVWAQELTFQKETIVKRLRKFLGQGEVVEDVQFYVGPMA